MNTPRCFKKAFRLFCLLSSLLVFTLLAENESLFDQNSTIDDGRINDDSGTFVQSRPSLAVSHYNFSVACWQDNRSGKSRIFAQRFGQRGLKFQNNFQVDPANATADQFNADIAIDDLGHFVIVWEEKGDSLNVYARIYAANKEPLTPILRVNERANPQLTSATPAVAMNEKGYFVVTWVGRHSDLVGDIYAQRFDKRGQKISNNFRVNDDTNHAQNYPDVAMNESGRFVIVWEDGRDLHRPSHLYEIYAHVYDSTGVAVGTDFAVSAHPAGTMLPTTPSVAIQANGNFLVTWSYAGEQIYGRAFRADKQTIKADFVLSTLGGGLDLPGQNVNPKVCRVPGGMYGLIWDSDRTGNSEIYFKSFDGNGNQVGGHVILNDSPGNQTRGDIAVSKKGLLICAWQDDRNGNPDIYGTWRTIRAPDNVIAANGYNGRVPLSWDHWYGKDKINRYKIWRTLGGTAPLNLIATVDLTARGSLGYSMRDYIDFAAVNGQSYLYRIEADDPESQGPSVWATATPSANGHSIQSKWAKEVPAINGILAANEWNDATKLEISTSYTPEPVTLYIKNTDTHLYIAVDDPNDLKVDPANTFGLMFDLDHNGVWDTSGPSKEGIIQITPANSNFIGVWGTYPNHLGADAAKNAAGITKSILTASGHVQYEISFEFASSPLKLKAGSTIGAALWVNDPGNHYFDHYGNAGEWPYGYLWEAAESLGDLTMAISAPPDTPPPESIILVTNTLDSGNGSLRAALNQANSNPKKDIIIFNIPPTDPGYDATAGVWVIRPNTLLPDIHSDSIFVDGSSQAKYLGMSEAPTMPLIVIEGKSGLHYGISISSSYNWINALTINNFEYQIVIRGHHNQISNCFIGTDPSGMRRTQNSGGGILLEGGDYNFIGGFSAKSRNVIAGCLRGFGLSFELGARRNSIAYNYIGINSAGSDTLGNNAGINITSGSNGNRIGPGNVVSGNYGYGISISQSDSTEIKGNLIGVDPTGTRAWGNNMIGIALAQGSRYTIIGGGTAAERNIISGNRGGISIYGGENNYNQIFGNFIGTDISANSALGNRYDGIYISAGSFNTIGGTDSLGNVISGNGGDGLLLQNDGTHDNLIVGNIIGSNRNGSVSLKNGGNGIRIYNKSYRNVIGPKNYIVFNEIYGVYIYDLSTESNTITRNSIFKNKLGGIKLYYQGNKELPAPVINGINPIVGTAIPNATIEIFGGEDAQGEVYLGTTMADAAGHFTFSGAISGDYITATATDVQGNTSEFSAPFSRVHTIIVTNCGDSGNGSLREAISIAKAHAGPDTIVFQIPLDILGYHSDAGVWRITLESELNIDDDDLKIDGRSQAAFIGRDTNPQGPEIVLTSSSNNPSCAFQIRGNHNHIDALTINNFRYAQISIYGDRNKVTGCYLGTDESGNRRSNYSQTGISIRGVGNIIGGIQERERNIISGLNQYGISLVYGANANTICGNYIGLNAAGTDTVCNRENGVFLSTDAHHNVIGPNNVISGNAYGIYFLSNSGDSNKVVGNFIGTNAAGNRILGNDLSGIFFGNGGAYTTIGGLEPNERNLISGNSEGITLEFADAHHIQIIGNYIGTDISGTQPLPNSGHGISISNGSHSNIVGPNNLIAFNTRSGIAVMYPNTRYNSISKNQIHSNGEFGIHLIEHGNDDIVAPVLSGFNPIVGTAPAHAIVEIFSGPDDEGMFWEATVMADADGSFSWSGTPTGKYITATATDAMGNTSPFSAALSTEIADNAIKMPKEFALHANFPNPFNPGSTITFDLPMAARVYLAIFDLQGRLIKKLLEGNKESGQYRVYWNGTDNLGNRVASGVYIYRLETISIAGNERLFVANKKMLLLK